MMLKIFPGSKGNEEGGAVMRAGIQLSACIY
jgi:hypothetical protein